jgi:hypothetical protein
VSKAKVAPVKRVKPKIIVEAFEYGLLDTIETIAKEYDVNTKPAKVTLGESTWTVKVVEREQESHSDYDADWDGFVVIEAVCGDVTEYIKADLGYSSYRDGAEIRGGISNAKLVSKVRVTVFKWEEVS